MAFYGEMWRLGAPGGSFTPTPEPSGIALCGILAASLGLRGILRRKRAGDKRAV